MGEARLHTVVDEQDLQQVFASAAERRQRLRIRGGDSKRAMLLCEPDVDLVLDLSGLRGVVAYEPGELVLTVKAGTPLQEVQLLLAENRQRLAFEPPDFAGLLGATPGMSTIGGVVASGLAGPARVQAGNARDHALGLRAVSARGEAFRAGGKVIKNVTGYDLPKLLSGSWGSLAAITELSLRVLPQPQQESTFSVEDVDEAAALAILRRALAAPLDVTAAACLPRDRRAVLRVEGFAESVAERLQQLQTLFGGEHRHCRVIEDEASTAIWRRVAEVWDLSGDVRPLWRLSLPADRAAALVAQVRESLGCAEAVYDWGGSLVWLLTEAGEHVAQCLRSACEQVGGHAWLFRADASMRRLVPTAHPQAPALVALSRRIKAGFDPRALLPFEPLLPPPPADTPETG